MIRYSLRCERGHDFESWFPSSGAFDDQCGRGLVLCPICDSPKVGKAIMAPSVATRSAGPPARPDAKGDPGPPPDAPASGSPGAVALLSEKEQAVRAMIRAVRDHVTRHSDYVGPGFAAEARRMHYGEVEHRSIYGEARADEARALLEEGIEIQPLPIAPDDRN